MGKIVKQVSRQHGAAACRARKGRSVRSHLMTSAAALVAVASFHPSAALAQENVWQGDADRDWYKDENWSEGVHPRNGPIGDSFHVIIDVEGPQSPVIEFLSNPDRLAESARLTIGSTGNGELTIRNGGTYSGGGAGRGRLRIGEQAGSRGLLTVSGEGSNFRLDNGGSPVEIGRYGEGLLVIDGGATFESTDTLIGSYAGSEGHVTVSGTNSTWAMLQDDPAYGSVIIVGNEGTGTLTIENGGSVLGAGPAFLHVGREAGGEGTVTVTGANSYLMSGTFFIGGDGAIRRSGTGTLVISDGGKVDSLSTNIGMRGTGAASVSGAGTSWNIDGLIRVGMYNAGTLAITDGAVVTATTGVLGESAGATGTALVDGAQSQWNISGDLKVAGRSSSFSEASEGSLILSNGGHVAVGGTLQIAELGVSTGTVYIGGDTAPAAAGTVSAGEILFGQGDGTLVFNHAGTAHLFDTSLRSVAGGQGSLSHRAGTTVLTGDSSGFSGATQISGGTVLLTGVLGGSVSLDSLGPDLAGLGGTGRLTGDLTVTSGLLRPGLEQGTLTIDGNLTLGSGATLRYDLGAPSGTPGVDSDLLVVGGDLVLDGTLEVTDVGGFGEGLYRLIDYGGALTDNGLAIGSRLPTGYDDTNLTVQTAIAGEINLLVGESNDPGGDPGAFQFWNGTQTTPNGSIAGGAGTWSATGTNWTNADGSQSGVYDPDAMLIFAGMPGYTVTVDGSEGPITMSGMQFAVPDYTIAGDAIALDGAVTIRVGDGTAAGAAYTAHIDSDLTGWGMLIKDDLGTLVLTGEGNSYRGGTRVIAGVLVGNGNSLPGDIVNQSIVEFSEDTASVYMGNMIGTGAVTKTGAGETTFAGANSYTGGTFIQDGALIGHTLSLQGEIEIGTDGKVTFDQDADGVFSGNITGQGRLEKHGSGLVHLDGVTSHTGGTELADGTLSGTTDSLQGEILTMTGTILAFDQEADGRFDGRLGGDGILMKTGLGTVTMAGDNSFFTGAVGVFNGTLVAESLIGEGGFVIDSPGHLKGTANTLGGDIAAGGTLTITENADATYAGRLSGNGGGLFIKDGDGILRLTGVNSFAGRTDIREGALHGNTQSLTGSMITMLEDTALVFNQSGDGSFAGDILGFGTLHKAGAGELHLTGSNNYTGGTIIHEGSLRGDTNSLQGDIDTGVLGNILTFDQGGGGTYSGDISGAGWLVKRGSGLVQLTGTTSHTGGTSIFEGTLSGTTDSLQGHVAIIGASTLVFDQDSNGSFDGELAGTGNLIKDGTGAVTLGGDSSNFTGQTDILAGVLAVNGSLGGNITVSGGALKGTGTFGNVTTGRGGIFAPGNSIGQSNTANVTFEAGSVFEVELNDGGFVPGVNNDAIHVTGGATLNGGTVHVTPDNGTDTGETYLPGTYTILTADGGVSGAFDGVTDDFVFLDFALDYDPTTVFLVSNRIAHFSDVALSANQAGIAATLDALDGGNDIVSALLGQTDEGAARHALDSLTGELHASLTTTLVEQSRITRDAAFARSYQTSRREGLELWIEGLAGNQRNDGTANTAALKNSRYGFLLGADTNVGSNLRVGAFAGYTDSDVRVADRGATASIDSTHLGAYVAGQWSGFGLQAGADISWHDIDADRQVNFTGFSDSLESAYSARTGQIYARMSYALSAGGATFAPFGEIAHVWHSSERFAETGGLAALAAEKVDTSVTFSTLGLRLGTEINLGQSRAEFGAEIGWRHAVDQPEASVHALRAGGDRFTVAGAPIAEDALSLGLGGRLALSDRASLSLGYNADLAKQYENHAFRAGLSFAF